MPKKLLLFVAVLGALAGLLAFRAASSPADREEFHTRALAACEDYRCVRRALKNALDDLGPRGALAAYASTSPSSGFGIDCHGAAHELGEWAWRDYGRSAWFPFPEIVCNYGYYHGMMVEIARSLELEEFSSLAHELCEKSPLPAEVLPGRECAHGFGHAVIHLTGSVETAVGRCNGFEGERFRRRCNEGIAKDLLREETGVDERDFALCGNWPAPDRGVCSYITAAYAVVHAEESVLGSVSAFCSDLPTVDESEECMAGLGRGIAMRAVGEDYRTPGTWAATVCGTSTVCAEDFGRSIFYVRDDTVWSNQECEALPVASVASCRRGVGFAAADRE